MNSGPSDDVFVRKARETFLEYATLWIKWMVEQFPDCQETKDCDIFLSSVVQNSDSQLTEQIDCWVTNMNTKLNPKHTKYAKAIERITGSPAVVYHALSYKDIAGMRENMVSEIAQRVNLIDKYEMADEAKRTRMHKFLDKISLAAFEAKAMTVPTVPSRSDIQDNIRQRREKSDDPPSMTRAFQTHINALCRDLNDPLVLEHADDETVRKWMSRWNAVSNAQTEGVKHSKMCHDRDVRMLRIIGEAFPEIPGLLSASESGVEEAVWKNVSQLNSFSTVTENIPIKMMGRIEDMANRLADDIVSGRTDMASVNLSDIGQQVLSGCDQADMSKFADNIDALLPALQNFHNLRPST